MPPTAAPAARDARPDLKTMDRAELEAFARSVGEPAFRGRQLFRWLYEKGATSFGEMTDLPRALRERLPALARIGAIEEVRRQTATDRTVKSLFRLPSGRHVEAVLIPDLDAATGAAKRLTVCVSSQVGCAMGCHFCATGLMGFQENLTAGQIVDQVRAMDAVARERFGRGVTNVVYMGMGEPLQNYGPVLKSTALLTEGLGLSPKRITVSTVGLARRIRQLADDQAAGAPAFGLAISLHAPTDPQRSAIMPVNRSEKTDLTALKEAVRYYHQKTGRGVTYEYCVFEGLNDTDEDARHLAAVTRWAPSKVNLIVYNPVEGAPFRSPSEAELERFIRALVAQGVTVTVRRSRGQDIDAACGQLAVRESVVSGQ
ncbi:MAG TPA: 23S rRNA (adenine(2503)-C(2))-methyltransferase RlmN [Rubricoccaceae bacterium]|nr:23S rRNA (adenine(2503)-C(2))-methyltransferase RlmN [Rubricoccaceae bacterium]